MDTNTVNTIRDLINATSLALCIVIIGLALIGFFRPKTLGFVLREFARRRYIVVGGVFAGLLCGTIYTATQPDYGSFDASQQKPAAQTQSSLPANSQTSETTGAEVQGSSTDQSQPSRPTTSASRPRPQAKSEPQPSPPPQGVVEAGPVAVDTRDIQPDPSEQPKPRKKCNAHVLFVCL